MNKIIILSILLLGIGVFGINEVTAFNNECDKQWGETASIICYLVNIHTQNETIINMLNSTSAYHTTNPGDDICALYEKLFFLETDSGKDTLNYISGFPSITICDTQYIKDYKTEQWEKRKYGS